MAKRYNATEYMYSTARLRSLETKIADRDQLFRLADAQSTEAIVAALSDFGFTAVYTQNGKLDREATLMTALIDGYSTVGEMNCADAVKFLRYQYDCNNVKAMIKCSASGISPDAMLLPFGSVELDKLRDAFATKDYSAFPKNMVSAIAEAEEAFAATGNPQKIDFIIDKATFADMLAAVKESGVPIGERLVTAKIDLLNILMTVRLIRMELGASAQALFDEIFIEGGCIEKKLLATALDDGEKALAEALAYGRYPGFAQTISAMGTLSSLEKTADDVWMKIIKEIKFIPFGAEVAIGYILGLEYEVKNIRIILASKDAGLSSDIIRERLRESYV